MTSGNAPIRDEVKRLDLQVLFFGQRLRLAQEICSYPGAILFRARDPKRDRAVSIRVFLNSKRAASFHAIYNGNLKGNLQELFSEMLILKGETAIAHRPFKPLVLGSSPSQPTTLRHA